MIYMVLMVIFIVIILLILLGIIFEKKVLKEEYTPDE